MRKFTGTHGIVKVGSTTLCITQRDITFSVDTIELTGTCDDGYQNPSGDLKRASGTVTAIWDADANPYDDPPNINEGEVVAIKTYLEYEGSGKYHDFPTALVTQIRETSAVAQFVTYTFDFQSKGTYTKATGTWAADT